MTEHAQPALSAEGGAETATAILQMATGFWPAQVLFTAYELGVFETLAVAPATAADLAAKFGLHADAGPRLFDAAVALGLLERRGDELANSPIADAHLVRGRVGFMGGFVGHARNDLYRLWGHLDDAVREGTPRWQQAFGATGVTNPFDEIYASPERLRDFMYAMQGGSLIAVEGLLGVYDFGAHRRLIDVGGALGTVAVAVAKRHPHIEAVSFDLAPVIPLAEEYIASQGVADRVRAEAGDMFAKVPEGADVIHMSWILHDWSDAQCVTILTRCREALEPGGVVLISESLVDRAPGAPVFPHLMSLNMLVATDGGRERTEDEFRRLVEAAGLETVRAERFGGLRDLVVARKP
jgi:acetylserotonin N-methyltransferase